MSIKIPSITVETFLRALNDEGESAIANQLALERKAVRLAILSNLLSMALWVCIFSVVFTLPVLLWGRVAGSEPLVGVMFTFCATFSAALLAGWEGCTAKVAIWNRTLKEAGCCEAFEALVQSHPSLNLLPERVRELRYADYLHAQAVVTAQAQSVADSQQDAACASLHLRLCGQAGGAA